MQFIVKYLLSPRPLNKSYLMNIIYFIENNASFLWNYRIYDLMNQSYYVKKFNSLGGNYI